MAKSKHKFSVGDKVLCVAASGTDLIEGEVYTVERCLHSEDYVVEGSMYSWMESRFVLVNPHTTHVPAKEDYHARKFDKGKPRIGLIPGECLEGIGEVLEYGARKYAKDSWKEVPDAEDRYLDALGRHFKEILKHGLRAVDEESGKLHIDHLTTNGAFLQYFARKT